MPDLRKMCNTLRGIGKKVTIETKIKFRKNIAFSGKDGSVDIPHHPEYNSGVYNTSCRRAEAPPEASCVGDAVNAFCLCVSERDKT